MNYQFTLPKKRVYSVWLRYAANSPARLHGRAGEALFETRLPPTGGLTGQQVWRWHKLVDVPLAAGPNQLQLSKAVIRPDCLLITIPGFPATDALLQRQPTARSQANATLLDQPLVPIRPSWLDRVSDYQLPSWFEASRVQAHTIIGAKYLTDARFLRFAEGFKTMGDRVLTRHVQGHHRGAWWPSKIGAVHPMAVNRNLAKEIINSSHASGIKQIVYYNHQFDSTLLESHPDWFCRDSEGQLVSHANQPFLCMNSPFVDYYLTRALELASFGADGFYFDFVHMPKKGCWCNNCKVKFKAATGLEHPKKYNPKDPVWRKLVEFNNVTIENAFLKWRQGLHAANPELVLVVSTHLWTGLSDHHLTNRLLRLSDSPKMEFLSPNRPVLNRVFQKEPALLPTEPEVRLALGFDMARDAADGRPPHVWTFGLLDRVSALHATAGMLTRGCIANLHIREETVPNMQFRDAFRLGDKVSPYLSGRQPLRWAIIHYPEAGRNRLALDEVRMWTEVLYPFYGAYQALFKARLPVRIVTDSQLEEGRLEGYRLLFLPTPGGLTPKMQQAVQEFEHSGGVVIRQHPDWRWHARSGGRETAERAFLAQLKDKLKELPLSITGGPEGLHAVVFEPKGDRRLTVALANEFSWVHTGHPPKKGEQLSAPPPPCRGVKVKLRATRKPVKVYNVITGDCLTPESLDGWIVVRVPDFEQMALLVFEF